MKENEYDNGYTERQTVGSNPPELPQIRVSVFENYFAQKPLGDVDLISGVRLPNSRSRLSRSARPPTRRFANELNATCRASLPAGYSRLGAVTGWFSTPVHMHRHRPQGQRPLVRTWSGSIRRDSSPRPSTACCVSSMSISGNGLYLIFRIAHPDYCTWHNSTLWFGDLRENGARRRPRVLRMSAACGEPVTMPTHTSIRTRSLIGAC